MGEGRGGAVEALQAACNTCEARIGQVWRGYGGRWTWLRVEYLVDGSGNIFGIVFYDQFLQSRVGIIIRYHGHAPRDLKGPPQSCASHRTGMHMILC